MLNNLNKYNLDFEKVWPFFKQHINWKSISLKILENINFEEGRFFTLLPNSARLERLYDFESGIHPPNPMIGNYEPITTLNKELSEFIYEFLSKSTHDHLRLSIIEHAYGEKSDRHILIENVNVKFIEDKEVYYILNSRNSIEQIRQVISASKSVWHFLGILTEGLQISENLEDNYANICDSIKYIITTAYDSEGFIFWERRSK